MKNTWYNTKGEENDVAVSSRVRFARNLDCYPFTNRLDETSAREIVEKVENALGSDFSFTDFREIEAPMARAYMEQHFVSPEFVGGSLPRALALSEDGSVLCSAIDTTDIVREIERLHRGDKIKLDELDMDAEDAFWTTQSEEAIDRHLQDRYQSMAVQVMRVLNFYSFNNADNTIDTLYYCGGGARYQALISELAETVEIPVKSIGGLLSEAEEENNPEWVDSPQTVGVLLD